LERGGLYAEMFEMQAASYRVHPGNLASQWTGTYAHTR
jgi:hypothetical protein